MRKILCVFLLSLGIPSYGWVELPRGEGDPLGWHDRLSSAVRSDLAEGDETLSVIVHLVAPNTARVPLQPNDTQRESTRQAVILPLIEREVAALASDETIDFEIIRRFRLQPAFAASISRSALAAILSLPAVRFVEKDLRWTVHTEEGLPLINAPAVHQLGFSGEGVAIAIVDTGIDPLHPALGGRPIPNAKIVRGLDTGDGDDDPTDCGDHGTAVAAVAAGMSYQWNPQRRFAGGVAPQAKILAYKASSDSDCTTLSLSAVVAAMEDAILHRSGADYTLAAINVSAGGNVLSGPCEEAVSSYARVVADAHQAGISVVASSGNDGSVDGIAVPACLGQVVSVGSVWDSNPGWTGFNFCLDPECDRLCNDSFVPRKSVTCYTNSNAMLDLLAPSEYLKTAKANGQTVEFGGTSGAAAYVSGALAILRQATPGIDPATARLRLQLSGEPILDRRNGVIRPLVDLFEALENPLVTAATAPMLAVPRSGGSSVVSSVWVNQSGRIGSVGVTLHISHQHPEHLRLTLSSPDGQHVLLHDRGSGSFVHHGKGVNQDGIWGTYPTELKPVESLGVFGGHEMSGHWKLVVEHVGGPDHGSGFLVDWGLDIQPEQDPSTHLATTLFVPVVAHQMGSGKTSWLSHLRIFNPSSHQSAITRLFFFPSSNDDSQPHHQADLFLPPQSSLELPDVVYRQFGLVQARGNLLVSTTGFPVIASSHTEAITGDCGRFGQFVGSITNADPAAAVGRPPVILPHIANDERFRTNVGLSETGGGEVTVQIAYFDGVTGRAIGSPEVYHLAPFSNHQTRVTAGGKLNNIYAVVTAVDGSGQAAAYASRIDNVTHDAVFVPGERPPESPEFMVPVVARTEGLGETRWRSELRIVNLGQALSTLDVELRPRQGVPGAMRTTRMTVQPGRAVSTDDVVRDWFDLDQIVGSLRLIISDGSDDVIVTSRAYNLTEQGTFGQHVAAVERGFTRRAAIVHLVDSQDARTNLGVCEISGGELVVRCRMYDPIGRPLGHPLRLELSPHQLVHITDVFKHVEASGKRAGWLELEAVDGDGTFFGYASVVDTTSGDAILVPAREIPSPDLDLVSD